MMAPDPNHRAKDVDILTRSGDTITFTIDGAGSYSASLSSHCWLSISDETEHKHLLHDTLTNPQKGEHGHLWLSHTWCANNGVAVPGDPKRPATLESTLLQRFRLEGRVLTVFASVVFKDDGLQRPVLINLRGKWESSGVPDGFSWPKVATFEPSEKWIMDNLDVDWATVECVMDDGQRKAVEKALGMKLKSPAEWSFENLKGFLSIADDLRVLGDLNEPSQDLKKLWTLRAGDLIGE